MTNRDKVITGLKHHFNDESSCMGCPYFSYKVADCYKILMKHMLEMLLEDQELFVRCKNCKHSKNEYGGMFCPKFGFVHQEDWFCADGIGKEEAVK